MKREELRKVKFKLSNSHAEYQIGYFHQFGLDVRLYESSGVSYTMAIIEDENGQVHLIIPESIIFV